MKLFYFLLMSLLLNFSFAHDEGHGPAIVDESLYGGKMSAVISTDDIKKGQDAKMLYKAELTHDSKKLEVKLYLYNSDMSPLDLSKFTKVLEATQYEKKGKNKFKLTLDESGKFYKGERPKNKRVPFDIDIKIAQDKSSLFVAFDGLD